jgi:hypothetical protein
LTTKRLTDQDVTAAQHALYRLAHTDPDTWLYVVQVVGWWLWLRDEMTDAERGAVYGPGTDAALGEGAASAVEARLKFGGTAEDPAELRDRYLRGLRKLVPSWRSQLRALVDGMDRSMGESIGFGMVEAHGRAARAAHTQQGRSA